MQGYSCGHISVYEQQGSFTLGKRWQVYMLIPTVRSDADSVQVNTMSGDNLRRVTAGEAMGDRADERLTPLVGNDSTAHGTASRDAIPESVLDSVVDDVADGNLAVDDGLVTQSLDEILLAVIALSDEETHGTGLMETLSRLFDAQLSPGTVYPRLHDLESDGTLTVHELVQTKQYSIDDAEAAASQIERAAYRHFVMGTFLQASLDAM
jgi:hypothetical protein